MTDLSLVIPVYRGAADLVARLPELLGSLDQTSLDYELVIVDDGSQDGQEHLLHEVESSRVHVHVMPQNRGKFAAIKEGMARAKGECCVFTDADLPYDFSVIPHMVKLIQEGAFHVVVGDRTLPGSIYRSELGLLRSWATRLFTVFVRLLVTGGLHDTQCGIKAFRGDVARALFPLLQEERFAGDVELLYVALMHNLAIRRVPARLVHQGPSTVHPFRDGLGMLRSILALRSRRRRGLYNDPELLAIAAQQYW